MWNDEKWKKQDFIQWKSMSISLIQSKYSRLAFVWGRRMYVGGIIMVHNV